MRRRPHNRYRLVTYAATVIAVTTPLEGLSLEVSFVGALDTQGRSRLSVTDFKKDRHWVEKESETKFAHSLRITAFPTQTHAADYQYQIRTYLNKGRIGKQVCAFFGCAFAGTNLATKSDISEQLSVSLPTHTLLFTGLLSPIPILGNFALGAGYIDGEARTFGAVESNFYEGKIPLLVFRLTNEVFRNDQWTTELNGTSKMFLNKNGRLSLNSIELFNRYKFSESIRLGLVIDATSFRAEYGNTNLDYRQRAISATSSLFVTFVF